MTPGPTQEDLGAWIADIKGNVSENMYHERNMKTRGPRGPESLT